MKKLGTKVMVLANCPLDALPLKPCAWCGHAVHDTAPGLPQLCGRCAKTQEEALNILDARDLANLWNGK